MEEIIKKIKNLVPKGEAKKTTYEKNGIKPIKDWGMLLVLSNLVVILCGLAAVYVYYQIDNDTFVSTESSVQGSDVKINTLLLSNIVNDLNDRADSFERIKSEKVPTDPSI